MGEARIKFSLQDLNLFETWLIKFMVWRHVISARTQLNRYNGHFTPFVDNDIIDDFFHILFVQEVGTHFM